MFSSSNRINRKNIVRQPVKFHDFWEMDDKHVSLSYQQLSKRIGRTAPFMTPKPAFNWWKAAAMAASIALLAVCGLHWLERGRLERNSVEIVYVTDRSSYITLSDGTKVWLCANSQLRYQQTFTGKTRDVTLDGEAFFEVARNPKQPFRVLAGGQTVEALGTSFNVRAYAQEQNVKVALVEGSVRVTDDMSGEAVVLKPAQEASIVKSAGSIRVLDNIHEYSADDNPDVETESIKDAGLIAVNDVDLDLMMSWKTGRYVFNNMTFEEIAKTLEKGFKVTINIENPMLKTKPYTMRFENNESLEEILDLIQINARYTYKYNNGTVVIK